MCVRYLNGDQKVVGDSGGKNKLFHFIRYHIYLIYQIYHILFKLFNLNHYFIILFKFIQFLFGMLCYLLVNVI